MDDRLYWYNFRTGEHEHIDTPSDFHDYIPQSPAAQRLYDLYIEYQGLSPIEACVKILEISAGVKND